MTTALTPRRERHGVVHTIAQNVELRVAETRQRDCHLIRAVVGAHRRSVDRKHDVARAEDASRPLRYADDEQTALATLAQIGRQLGADRNHAKPCYVDGLVASGAASGGTPRNGGSSATGERTVEEQCRRVRASRR